jgi:hypothetical protein
MNEHLKLSRVEWELIVELLQREHGRLPIEIHHCRVRRYREGLRRRLELVEGLQDRVQVAVEVLPTDHHNSHLAETTT